MTKRSVGEVLLELLELAPDAESIELFLEPENLRAIANARGVSDDELRRRLAKGEIPGEILLAILRKEPDPKALRALCRAPITKATPGASIAEPARNATATPAAFVASPPPVRFAGALPGGAFDEVSGLNKIGTAGVIASIIVPALIIGDVFSLWRAGLSDAAWTAIATIGASLFGVLFVHRRAPAWVGLAGGPLVAPGAVLGIWWYTRLRPEPMRLEIVLAFAMGATPGLLAFGYLFRRATAHRPSP